MCVNDTVLFNAVVPKDKRLELSHFLFHTLLHNQEVKPILHIWRNLDYLEHFPYSVLDIVLTYS